MMGSANLGSAIGDLWSAYKLGGMNFPNPATGAMKYLNQIPGMLSQYMSPYVSGGQNAYGTLQGQYGTLLNNLNPLMQNFSNLVSNPGAVFNKIGSNFQASPGYNFQVQQAQTAANNAAAAGGTLGSPAEQQTIASNVNQLANSDFYNYMNHALNLYGIGMGGMNDLYSKGLSGEQGLNTMGFQSAQDLAHSIMQSLMSQASLSYAGQADENQMKAGQEGAQAGLEGAGIGNLINWWDS